METHRVGASQDGTSTREIPKPAAGLLAVLTRREILLMAAAGILWLLLLLLQFCHVVAWLSFLLSAALLTLLSLLIAKAADQLSERCGPVLSATVQAGLGNVPELLVSLFALRSGFTALVQYALLGSVLGNGVLVLGSALLIGGWRHRRSLLFQDEVAQNATFALWIALAGLIISTLVHWTPAMGRHQDLIDLGIACCLLLFFVASTIHFLTAQQQKSNVTTTNPLPNAGIWPVWLALAVLVGALTQAASASEWFVGSLTPTMESLHLSPLFVGMIIVPLAGNTVEHIGSVLFAWRNKADLAMSTISMSSLQVLGGLFPLLVVLSWCLPGMAHLSFVTPLLPLAVVFLSLITSHLATFDGRGNQQEGAGLLAWYGIVALVFLWT